MINVEFSVVLEADVASNWLPCFPISAREYVYDVFFVNGLVTEVVQTLVPYLQYRGTDGFDANVVVSNIERLIVLCLIENNGVLRMARELGASDQAEDFVTRAVQPAIARVAQVIASVPDKARPRPSSLLSSQYPYSCALIVHLHLYHKILSFTSEINLSTYLLLECNSRGCNVKI